MDAQQYRELVKKNTPARPIIKNMFWAFIIGGLICTLGQIFLNIATVLEQTKAEASAVTLAAMIFLGTILTGFGVYDEIAELAGAGAAIPITGFANTVTSAAMDFKREGALLGMGSKMFVIAGPVIVYGILSGFFVALIKSLILGLF